MAVMCKGAPLVHDDVAGPLVWAWRVQFNDLALRLKGYAKELLQGRARSLCDAQHPMASNVLRVQSAVSRQRWLRIWVPDP